MKTNLFRTLGALLCVGGFALALTSGSAVAFRSSEIDSPFDGIIVTLTKSGAGHVSYDPDDLGVVVARSRTDAQGKASFSGLAPGSYVLVIDGPSLVAAIDKLAPPAPEKKSNDSFSLGIGGGMFGGGSSHASSGHPGAGPVGGGHDSHSSSHSSGGGVGVGLSIPIGGGDGEDRDSHGGGMPSVRFDVIFGANTDNGKGNPMAGGSHFSVETPYNRAATGILNGSTFLRMRITVPENSGSDAETLTFICSGSTSG